MSFSLKWLFVLVAGAAILAGALIYHSPQWAIILVAFCMLSLTYGTLHGVAFPQSRGFWPTFTLIGWLYLVFSLISSAFVPAPIGNVLARGWWWEIAESPSILTITHCLFGLVLSTLGGVFASSLSRHKADNPPS